MSLNHETKGVGESPASDVPAYKPGQLGGNDVPPYKPGSLSEHARGRQFSVDPEDLAMVTADQNMLHRDLKGRHMQMIAM
jgi:amino acid transporter